METTSKNTVETVDYNSWQQRALRAERKLETVELVVLYAQDIVDMWPTTTLRTLWKVTDKIASLKEAIRQITR